MSNLTTQVNDVGYTGRSITETVINGFFTVDRQWTVQYWNKAAEQLLGVMANDIVGKNLWEEFAGIIPLDFYRVYHKAFLQKIPVHFEEYWGEMGAWFDVVIYYCDDILSVSFKSSRQSIRPANPKRPQEQLQIIHELYRVVTEVTNDCLWEWDLQTRELFWIDGGHKRVFGYQVENALIPQSFWEHCVHPDDKARILTRLNQIVAWKDRRVWEDEYRFKKANGAYAYVHDRAHIIYGDDGACRMIGATQDITEKILLEKKLTQERQTSQKEITDAVITAQEKERAAIGRELNENLGQILAAARMYIQMAIKSGQNREMLLEKSSVLVANVIEEIRKLSRKVSLPGPHIFGLFDNIHILVKDLGHQDPVKIEFHTDNIKEEDLDEKMQLNIFRIVQEQMNNIVQHANATHATIDLTRQANDVILRISDNGEGYDISHKAGGVGIINIKSRVNSYRGKVTIISKPGKGYELNVVLPLNDRIPA